MLPLDFLISKRHAGVAELADAQDSGSCEVHPSCGFESHLRYSDCFFSLPDYGDSSVESGRPDCEKHKSQLDHHESCRDFGFRPFKGRQPVRSSATRRCLEMVMERTHSKQTFACKPQNDDLKDDR